VRETSRASGTAVVTQPLRKAAGQMGVPEWAGGLPPATSDVLDGVILDKPVRETQGHERNNSKTSKKGKKCALSARGIAFLSFLNHS